MDANFMQPVYRERSPHTTDTTSRTRAVFIIAENHEEALLMNSKDEIRFGGIAIRYLVEGFETNGTLAMFEFDVEPGGKVPGPHSHDAYEETAYGLEGTLTFTVAGNQVGLGPGQSVVIPRGAVHRFDNLGATGTRTLAIITPGLLGPDFFREIAAVLGDSAGGPPNLAAIGDVQRRHGLTPAPS
jgi:quercetin dioxygenase-like cupin family protein